MENRLKNEYRTIQRQAKALADEGIALAPVDPSSLLKWEISLTMKDKESPYAGQTYKVLAEIPSGYPLDPPQCKFLTRFFHPNVNFTSGDICLNILKKEDWTPAISLVSLAQCLLCLFSAPNTDSPLNCDASNLVKHGDMRAFKSIVRYYDPNQ
ncbi:Ubiquitin-conjugating enzyme E2-17 kDa [Giardia muris]|uniref:Ubiquitin-conjugating enzyme E2-17 kDa n=1 Tax=Giardia muris TaxID=5742 RepID=A0A4Z1SVY1_GIAMU|nr:Ubiquitin-conjugating enzyme E2-17 kDa [Giardia muris]|eukprot:TNJ29924.1 Ubiquitin-conjugating enzyme E2-17 kDa [Giardia muris]